MPDQLSRSAIITALSQLDADPDQFAVVGSAVLAVHNIRPAGDIDLVITAKLYQQLLAAGWHERPDSLGHSASIAAEPFEAALNWNIADFHPDVAQLITQADHIAGWRFVGLTIVEAWKRAAQRPKDLTDLQLIAAYHHHS